MTQMNDQFLARANTYRLLSALYYEPEPAFLEEDVFSQLQNALSTLDASLAADAAALGAGFRDADPAALTLDYTRLFLGPFGIEAKPYGSVYLDGESTVMGPSTQATLALYGKSGFQVDAAFLEMPDHIAVELEFLYLLNHRLAQNGDTEAAELKAAFLSTCLGRWVDPFTRAVEQGAQTDFYRQLARLTRNLVRSDLQSQTRAV